MFYDYLLRCSTLNIYITLVESHSCSFSIFVKIQIAFEFLLCDVYVSHPHQYPWLHLAFFYGPGSLTFFFNRAIYYKSDDFHTVSLPYPMNSIDCLILHTGRPPRVHHKCIRRTGQVQPNTTSF